MKITALPSRSFMRRLALPKLILISVLFAICYLLFATGSALAYDTAAESSAGYNQESSNNGLNTNSDVPLNLHNITQIVLLESMSAVACQLSGIDLMSKDGRCLGVDTKTGKIGFVENGGGAIAVVGSLIDVTLTPPISSTQYLAYVRDNFGVVKSAHAQTNPCIGNARGVGFCSIEPVIDLWVAMRNIVYLILILVFVVIGLGIMLRIRIDPRTVMTIQNQIPKIVVGIIVITFSFAIAGFLIDVMWVSIYLFAGVISSATGDPTGTMTNVIQSANPFDAVQQAYPPQNGSVGGIVDISSGTANAFSQLIVSSIDSLELGLLEEIIGGILSVLAFIIIFIAIIVALIRLWVTLVITYINILLDVIFAPFWIVAGLLPGSSMGMSAWFRDLVANLAVFPVAISFFLLGSYFVNVFGNNTNNITTAFAPPLLGGINNAAVAAIIGLGFILMLPNVLSTVKAALKAPKLNFGSIMSPVSAGGGFLAGTVGRSYGGSRAFMQARQVSNLPRFEGGKYMGTDTGRLGMGQTFKRMVTGTMPTGGPKK